MSEAINVNVGDIIFPQSEATYKIGSLDQFVISLDGADIVLKFVDQGNKKLTFLYGASFASLSYDCTVQQGNSSVSMQDLFMHALTADPTPIDLALLEERITVSYTHLTLPTIA